MFSLEWRDCSSQMRSKCWSCSEMPVIHPANPMHSPQTLCTSNLCRNLKLIALLNFSHPYCVLSHKNYCNHKRLPNLELTRNRCSGTRYLSHYHILLFIYFSTYSIKLKVKQLLSTVSLVMYWCYVAMQTTASISLGRLIPPQLSNNTTCP